MKKTRCAILSVLFILLFVSCGQTPMLDNKWIPADVDVWEGSPAFLGEPHPENIEIELSMDADSFSPKIESITVRAVNTKGESFRFSPLLLIEKKTAIKDYGYEGDFWVRLPYKTSNPFIQVTSAENRASFIYERKNWKNEYEFTQGQYRFVVFIESVPHYIEFKIT